MAKLVPVPLLVSSPALPADVLHFLQDAEARIESFQIRNEINGFVPSDFRLIYQALWQIQQKNLAAGTSFCEWGSGFGVICCLAAHLGYSACGIEISKELVTEAQLLADDYSFSVEFYCDSFIPHGGESCIAQEESSSWLEEQPGNLEEEGISPSNYDVIFVYPWPGEERITEKLFLQFASPGALLLSFHGRDGLRLQRKVRESHPRRLRDRQY
ncbi:MAG TPA: hypothetical protein PKA06_05350 [Gemmatales bacterium]|nr:hypothetical protein [Gemmatales bacterium]